MSVGLSMVYGGGGMFGIAYGLGVASGLASAGVPVASAPALGTSAGSWVASTMALGIDFDEICSLEAPSVPNPRRNVLHRLASQVFGDARDERVTASAVCVRSRRRHLLSGARYPLADIVAASSAVPGLFAPHRIDGRLYIDGGMWSATSVDAASLAEHVIVVAPLAGRVIAPVGVGAGMLLGRELRSWRSKHPDRRIDLIVPEGAVSRLAGRNPMNLFDQRRAAAVYPLAYEQGCRIGEQLVERQESLAA